MGQFITNNQWIFWVILILGFWTLPWKAWALWKSARRNEKWWFFALLVIHTAGLLEILYIFIFSRKKQLDNQKAD